MKKKQVVVTFPASSQRRELPGTTKVLVAYHHPCCDGIVSAYIMLNYLPKDYNVGLLPMEYSQESYDNLILAATTLQYKELYIVDFSIPLATLATLAERCPDTKVVILDHHKTAFERYAPEMLPVGRTSSAMVMPTKNSTVYLDNDQSGASMAWEYLRPYESEIPAIVTFAKDYDLWRFEYGEETKYVHELIGTILTQLELGADLQRAMSELHHLAVGLHDSTTRKVAMSAGKSLLEVFEQACQYYTTLAYFCEILETELLIVAVPHKKYASTVGNLLAKDTEFGIAAVVVDQDEDNLSVSLRSVGDVDCTTIAKAFGGGGHKNAAGFSINKRFFDEEIDVSTTWEELVTDCLEPIEIEEEGK